MSRGGAERRRAGGTAPAAGSSRVTPPSEKATARQRPNWLAITLIALVLIGLVGGYFVAFVGS